MERELFYNASPLLFSRARELRKNPTPSEMLLWSHLRTRPLGLKFRRQHPFGLYILDFFCFKLKLTIEVDGPIHELEENKNLDEERRRWLESEGLIIIRFTNEEINKHYKNVIARIDYFINLLLSLHDERKPNYPLQGAGGKKDLERKPNYPL
ncbi:MAG TPA: endonuclease domain-containing protein [Chitinophagaceae bacterium]|nr:endonuclease domain-containing protein [Chitinophagaceae bacterium]